MLGSLPDFNSSFNMSNGTQNHVPFEPISPVSIVSQPTPSAPDQNDSFFPYDETFLESSQQGNVELEQIEPSLQCTSYLQNTYHGTNMPYPSPPCSADTIMNIPELSPMNTYLDTSGNSGIATSCQDVLVPSVLPPLPSCVKEITQPQTKLRKRRVGSVGRPIKKDPNDHKVSCCLHYYV